MARPSKDLRLARLAYYYCRHAALGHSLPTQEELANIMGVHRSQVSRWLKEAKEAGYIEETPPRLVLPRDLLEEVESQLLDAELHQQLMTEAFPREHCPHLKRLVVARTPARAADEDARIPFLATHCVDELMQSIGPSTKAIGWAWGMHCLEVARRLRTDLAYDGLECIPMLGTTAIGRGLDFAQHVRNRQASRICELAAARLGGQAVPLPLPAFAPVHLVEDDELPAVIRFINGIDEARQVFGEDYFVSQGLEDVAELLPDWDPERAVAQLARKGKLGVISAVVTSVGSLGEKSPILQHDLLPDEQVRRLRESVALAGDLSEQVQVLQGQQLSEETLTDLARLRWRAIAVRIRDLIAMVANGASIHVLAARGNRAEAAFAAVHAGAVTHLYIDHLTAARILEIAAACRRDFGYPPRRPTPG